MEKFTIKILNFCLRIYKEKRLLLFFIFLISLLTSVVFLLLFEKITPVQHHVPGPDYLNYYKPVAENILKGKGVTKEGSLFTMYPPAYPLILSLIFFLSSPLEINELFLISVFNIILTAVAACFIFLIGELIFTKKIGFIASLLWLTYPFNLWLVRNPNTEVPFIFLLYLGIYFYILSFKKKSWKYIFPAGIIFGFSSLIRPTSVFFSFFLALLIIFLAKDLPGKSRCFLVVVLLMGNILVVLPWEIYAFFQIGELIPISTLGPKSFKIGFTSYLGPGIAGDRVIVSTDVQALMERALTEDFNSGSDIFYFSLKELINRPVPFFKLLGLKALRAWYATSSKWHENLILIVQIPYILTVFMGPILEFRKGRKKIGSIILLSGIIVYFWIMTIYGHSILRYMVPAMGLAVIFSAVALNELFNELFKKYGFYNNTMPK